MYIFIYLFIYVYTESLNFLPKQYGVDLLKFACF